MVVRTRVRTAKARAPEPKPVEYTIAAVANLKLCTICGCVTNHERGACEFQEWHEQPRSE